MKTIADALIEKGKLRGVEKMGLNMLESNLSLETISIVTKLSTSKI